MNARDIPVFDGIDAEQELPALSSMESECAVLSILAAFPAAFDDVSDTLSADCFLDPDNRKIFLAVSGLIASGRGFDTLAVIDALRGQVDAQYLASVLQCHDYSQRGFSRHVQQLIDLHRSRQLHALSFKMAELAYSKEPVSDRIDQAQAALNALDIVGGEDEWIDAYTAAVEHTALIDARERGEVSGLATGYADLDGLLDGGPVRGNLVVIGARPAMGKTALAMSIGLSMAQDLAVGFVSLEMPHNDVRDRQTAILGKLAIGDIKRPRRGAGLDYERLVGACERAKTLRWNVSAKSSMNIQQLRSSARKLKRTRGLDVLIVDYIGLMSGIPGKNYGATRVYEIQDITVGLKSLAKELDIAVIALAQVGRGSDPKKAPTLRDLRDSGSIEQDADIVAFIHRPIQETPELGDNFANYALLRVAKNRQGATGDVHLFYRGEITGFESWAGPVPVESSIGGASSRGRGMD